MGEGEVDLFLFGVLQVLYPEEEPLFLMELRLVDVLLEPVGDNLRVSVLYVCQLLRIVVEELSGLFLEGSYLVSCGFVLGDVSAEVAVFVEEGFGGVDGH